jgi:predicted transcriptional regulator
VKTIDCQHSFKKEIIMERNLTIGEFNSDLGLIRSSITNVLKGFEEKYGQDIIKGIKIYRHNGSNEAFGPINHIDIPVTFGETK